MLSKSLHLKPLSNRAYIRCVLACLLQVNKLHTTLSGQYQLPTALEAL